MFRQDVSKLIQRALDINISLYDLNIIIGLPGKEDIFWIINFCILCGKKYIFDCRINENIVSRSRNLYHRYTEKKRKKNLVD